MATAPSVPTLIEAPPLTDRPHRPWLAAVLSFIFPGLGQAYAGRPRIAAIFAIPVVMMITTGLLVVVVLGETLRNGLLSTDFLVAILALNVLLFLWRAVAISEAGLVAGRASHRRHRRAAVVAVGGLLLLTLAMHGWVAVVVAHLNETLTQVFAPTAGGADDGTAAGDGAPRAGDDDPGTGAPAEPAYRWDGRDRINILLIGTDAAPGRDQILTDVILAVSVDPVAQTAVMISVPRDTGYLPLPDDTIYADGAFPRKINELASMAAADPELWCPDLDITPVRCGIRTLQESVGLYVGLDIQHYAIVDMAGFAELVDALGGVDLCLPGRLVDPDFGADLRTGDASEPLELPAGCRRYTGLSALAYARSRQGWIEMPDGERVTQTDFDRNERQQRLLLAVRDELADSDLLFELPAVLRAVARTVDTDFPRDRAGDLASLLPLIAGPDIDRVVLGQPEFVDPPLEPDVYYVLRPRRDAIRDEMARLFGEDELRGWYLTTERPEP